MQEPAYFVTFCSNSNEPKEKSSLCQKKMQPQLILSQKTMICLGQVTQNPNVSTLLAKRVDNVVTARIANMEKIHRFLMLDT